MPNDTTLKPCPNPACNSTDIAMENAGEDMIAFYCCKCNLWGPMKGTEFEALSLWNQLPRHTAPQGHEALKAQILTQLLCEAGYPFGFLPDEIEVQIAQANQTASRILEVAGLTDRTPAATEGENG